MRQPEAIILVLCIVMAIIGAGLSKARATAALGSCPWSELIR